MSRYPHSDPLPAAARPPLRGVRRSLRRAFTLVELLAVIGIIGILGGIIGVAFSGGSSGAAAIGNAQRMVSGMFQAARSYAVMKGVETAVIFYGTGNQDTEKYLRYVGIIYKDGGSWKALNRGSYLPKGVYFVPPVGNVFGGTHSSSDSMSTIQVNFPLTVSPSENWYAYEFESNGNLKASTYILLAPASVSGPPDNGAPSLNGSQVQVEEMAGIALRKTGGTMMIDYLGGGVYTKLADATAE